MIKNVLLLIFGCKVKMIFFNPQIYFLFKLLKISQLKSIFRIRDFCP
jgi:hypothetical protein